MTRRRCDTCNHPEHGGIQLTMQGYCPECETCQELEAAERAPRAPGESYAGELYPGALATDLAGDETTPPLERGARAILGELEATLGDLALCIRGQCPTCRRTVDLAHHSHRPAEAELRAMRGDR